MLWNVAILVLYVAGPVLTHRRYYGGGGGGDGGGYGGGGHGGGGRGGGGGHFRRHSDYWCEDTEPEVTVFKPKGLRIVIDCRRGVKDIEIRGKFGPNEVRAPFEKNYLERQRRRWIFEDDNLWLAPGDNANFELFATNWRDVIHTIHRGDFEVKELMDRNRCKTVHCCTICPPPRIDIDLPTPPPSNSQANLDKCQEAIINASSHLLTLQTEVDRMNRKNQLLLRIFNDSIDATRLTLSGVLPQDDPPQEVVTFILWEKLDMKPKIVSAGRTSPNSIEFEVETLEDKLEILEEAEEGLKNTRIDIS